MIKDPSDHQLPDKDFNQLMELFPKYISGFHRSMGAFYEAGNDLIVDHVLQEEEWYRECINICKGKRAYFIGVECPLDIINEREKKRGDRPIGMAKHQYSRIHGEGIYDVKVDTSILSPEECAKKIYAYIEENPKPEAFDKLSELISQDNH